MRQVLVVLAAIGTLVAAPVSLATTPTDDLELYRNYFLKRFPGVPLEAFGNGVYAIDLTSRDTWEAIEEFPPYWPMIEEGEILWKTPFVNGKTYWDCFGGDSAIRGDYPRWDKLRGRVLTLPLALNECREANGEQPLKYGAGELASLLAFVSYESRGQITNVEVPSDDPRAVRAYEQGKRFYFSRRGQLNFSCASCHMESSGLRIRTEILSPSLGHTSGWPVYRAKWGELGTLHRRFYGCNKQVRARPFPLQGEEYRNLEYFLTHMSNGIPFNGPSSRK